MGIYIQGVDMPKQGELLQIRIYDDGKVSRVYDIECQQIGTAIETPNELVRCKDCRHSGHCAKTLNLAQVMPNMAIAWVQPIKYCSYGERREP